MKLKVTLFSLSILLLVTPFLLWGNTYLVGGDDTKLYYNFPGEFLKNYSFNIISDNTLAGAMTGYQSVAYFAPFFFIILLFKIIPFISTQMLLYGINLAGGFYFFYLILAYYLKPKRYFQHLELIMASLLYVFSTYSLKTVYIHQLVAFYLISIFPFSLYLFIRGVRENKIYFIFLCSIFFSLLSTTLDVFPWFLGLTITIFPLLLFEFIAFRRQFIKSVVIVVILFLLLNFYWIFPFIYSTFHNTGKSSMLQYYSSASFIADNIRIITGVSRMFNPFNIVFFQMDSLFPKNSSILTYLQGVYFLCIICAGIALPKFGKKEKMLYALSLISFLMSWFLFSPNFSDFGPNIFLFLSTHIPLFTMFRNMYDKFALSISFSYAFLFGVSIFYISSKIKNLKIIYIGLIILIFIFIPSTLLSLDYVKIHTVGYSKFSGSFNDDYVHLTKFLNIKNNPSKVLWIPLNSPTYVSIEDKKYQGNFYSGLSPLRELANVSDYAGRFSFIRQNNLFLGDQLFSLLQQKKYKEVGYFLQESNTKYIVINKQLPPPSLQSFYYGGVGNPVLSWQNNEFLINILGNKIMDFGNRYSLYEINNSYANDKLYLTQDINNFPQGYSQFSYRRNSSSLYTLTIHHLSENQKLVFLDPYYKDWVLYIVNNEIKIPYQEGKNFVVFKYANGWNISPKEIKQYGNTLYTRDSDGSINVKMELYFKPQLYSIIANWVSLIAAVISVFISLYLIRRKKYEKNILQ